MLICLSPSAILLKITLIIHKEEKKQKPTTILLPLLRAEKAGGAEQTLPGSCSHSSAENSLLARQSHAPCLAQAPGCSARPCQSPAQQEEGGSGQQMLLTLNACHEQKGQEKSWRGSDLFFFVRSWEMGLWGDGGGRGTAPLRIAAPSKLALSLLGYYCYRKGK